MRTKKNEEERNASNRDMEFSLEAFFFVVVFDGNNLMGGCIRKQEPKMGSKLRPKWDIAELQMNACDTIHHDGLAFFKSFWKCGKHFCVCNTIYGPADEIKAIPTDVSKVSQKRY